MINCCLIKKLYHIKGKIEIIKNGIKNNNIFTILFSADSNLKGPICSIKEYSIVSEKKQLNICLGSTFPCSKKEFNNKTLIES